VRSVSDVRKLLNSGADKVSINSAAIKNPELIKESAKKFGSQSIIAAIDVKKNHDIYEIYINGGRVATGIEAISWIDKMVNLGAGEILLTSMDKDGTKLGYDLDLLKLASMKVNVPIIASGGVGNLEHLALGIKNGASAVLAASIFHFKNYSIKEAKNFLQSKNILVRMT
jgi:cyclase